MDSNNCKCHKYPEATFMKDTDSNIVYVDSLFCPICFRQFVAEGDYTKTQYLADKRKHKEMNK